LLNLINRIPICPHGTKKDISVSLVAVLTRIEESLGFDLPFTSGYRCPECNTKAGGKPDSAHLTGKAVDIACHASGGRYLFLYHIFLAGVDRIGVGKGFLHIDISVDLPRNVTWLY
jgi:uncharacterized protein YcbK (DUF882 family)